jgi:hypothetical protein
MVLNLRPLLILVLPLMSQFLSLGLWSGLIALDAPGPSPFPVSIIMPALPVLLKSLVRNPLIVPRVSVPMMISVVSSPTWVYIKIKTWNSVIISPTPVIIMRAIPTTFPWTPPPAIVEKDVFLYVGDNVDIRLRYHDHLWWCGKYDGRWQRKSNMYIDRCHCLDWKDTYQR